MSSTASTAAAKRRPYHHGDLRNALLASARRLAHEVGPDALTLRAVARGAGVSHAAAYNHFQDKNDLLRGLAIEAFEEFADELRPVHVAGGTLADLGGAYVRFAFGNPVVFRFMFRRELCGPEGEPDPLGTASLAARGILHDRIVALQGEGSLAAGDPERLVLAAWSQIHGITTIMLETPSFKGVDAATAEQIARQMMDALVEGLAKR